jgi:DNA recombination-dependent growth factor C
MWFKNLQIYRLPAPWAITSDQLEKSLTQGAFDGVSLSDAQAKREANKAHKAKINNAALSALVDGGISEECAKACVILIASGSVPNVQIS